MKLAILLATLFIGAFLVQDSEAWRYWGGRGLGWGGRFGGWGLGRGLGWGGWGLGRGFGWGGYGLGGGLGWGGLGLYSPWYSLGYRYYRDTMSRGNIEHRIGCNYISEKSILVCQREDVGVECEVVANLTSFAPIKNYELFGIGHVWNVEKDTPVALTRYNLYPRLVDNSAWLNHTTVVNGQSIHLSLFHSVSYVPKYFGYRITNSECFGKLVELIRSVPVTSYENITIVNEKIPARNVSLFGEILVKKIKV